MTTREHGTIVITGGASGIGAATAHDMVATGAHVALLDINAGLAQQTAEALGPKASYYEVDATDEAAVAAVGEQIAASGYPPVTGLVASAGVAQPARAIEDMPVSEFSRILETHIQHSYIAARQFGAGMAERGFGSIVMLASVLALRAGPVLAYGTGKAGIVSLTSSLAVHWGAKGVRVNAVAPGWTDTPLLRGTGKDRKPRDFTPVINATPLGRMLTPQEIADVIVFLLSDKASAISGATIPCDGGYTAGTGWHAYGGIPGAD